MINQVLEDARVYTMKLEERVINPNPTPKILEVTLDENLKYGVHTEQIERKDLRSLSLLQ